jgi:myo-inositol-1(or 4)-monophosphatase
MNTADASKAPGELNAADLQDARDLAESLCRDAATITARLSGTFLIERKSDDSPVTDADLRIQEHIVDALAQRYPDHAIIGEESIDSRPNDTSVQRPNPGEAEYTWVIDPLDGTRNFTHTFPVVATSIALLHGSQPVVGVIMEHRSGWTCSAVAKAGTLCNGARVRVTNTPADKDTLIAVPSGRGKPILPAITTYFDKYVLRNVGSTALHMAYAAAGAVDAVFCYECKIWDVAAGVLLIAEAGGLCTSLTREPLTPFDLNRDSLLDIPFFVATPANFDSLFAELDLSQLPG